MGSCDADCGSRLSCQREQLFGEIVCYMVELLFRRSFATSRAQRGPRQARDAPAEANPLNVTSVNTVASTVAKEGAISVRRITFAEPTALSSPDGADDGSGNSPTLALGELDLASSLASVASDHQRNLTAEALPLMPPWAPLPAADTLEHTQRLTLPQPPAMPQSAAVAQPPGWIPVDAVEKVRLCNPFSMKPLPARDEVSAPPAGASVARTLFTAASSSGTLPTPFVREVEDVPSPAAISSISSIGSAEWPGGSQRSPTLTSYWRTGAVRVGRPPTGAADDVKARTPPKLTIVAPTHHPIVPLVRPIELPVRSLKLWCRDPQLERHLAARMYRENFSLHMALGGLQLAMMLYISLFSTDLFNLFILGRQSSRPGLITRLLTPTNMWCAVSIVHLAMRYATHYGVSDPQRAQCGGALAFQWCIVLKALALLRFWWLLLPLHSTQEAWPMPELMRALPACTPFCFAIDSFMVQQQLAMTSPSSSSYLMARRLGVALLLSAAEIGTVSATVEELALMPMVSHVCGLLVAYFHERTQRTNLLVLLRLADQLSHQREAARAEEKELVQRVFSGPDLPSLVLQARVDLGDLQLQHTLGEGSFGRVCIGLWHGQGGEAVNVAVKTLHRTRIVEGCLRSTVSAAELELSLQPHPNVARLLGVAWSIDSARVVLIFEYLAGGDLATLLDSGRCREWSMAAKISSAAGLSAGLAFLHDQCVVHCDLKPGTSPPRLHPMLELCAVSSRECSPSTLSDITCTCVCSRCAHR